MSSTSKNIPGQKNRRLTMHQERFAEEAAKQYLETGIVHQTKAAIAAGYAEKSARVSGSLAFQNDDVRAHYLQCLAEAGVDDRKVTRVINDAMDAKRTVIINSKEGLVDYEIDHATRMKAVQEYNKIKGVYKEKTVNVNKRTANINLYSDMRADKLAELREKLSGEAEEIESFSPA